VRFGVVIDFLDLYIGDLHWPAFNVADSAITVGVVIFAAHMFFTKKPA
jgi:signal peptidase II